MIPTKVSKCTLYLRKDNAYLTRISRSLLYFSMADCNAVVDDLYDEDADGADQRWIDKHWARTSHGKLSAEQRTDATLSCPLCFTTVCMACQRSVGK